MFPFDLSYLRPNLGDDNRLYWRYLRYINKVLAIEPSDLIAFWPLNEAGGATADNAQGTAARDGGYTGVTLGQEGFGDGQTVPLFDGANDFVDIYSASLRDAFDGAKGTIAVWAKVSAAGIWADNAYHWLTDLRADGNNIIQLLKNDVTGANNLQFQYKASGTNKTVQLAATPTDWFHIALTWDAVADKVIAYYNGAQTGATQTGLGTWAGNIIEDETNIGALNEDPAFVWDGWLGGCPVWTKALTPAQILSLATV